MIGYSFSDGMVGKSCLRLIQVLLIEMLCDEQSKHHPMKSLPWHVAQKVALCIITFGERLEVQERCKTHSFNSREGGKCAYF